MGESPFFRCSCFQKLCRMPLGVLFFATDAHAACLICSASSISSHSLLEEELSHSLASKLQEDESHVSRNS